MARWYKYRIADFENQEKIIKPNGDMERVDEEDGLGLDNHSYESNEKGKLQPEWSETAKL